MPRTSKESLTVAACPCGKPVRSKGLCVNCAARAWRKTPRGRATIKAINARRSAETRAIEKEVLAAPDTIILRALDCEEIDLAGVRMLLQADKARLDNAERLRVLGDRLRVMIAANMVKYNLEKGRA